MATARVKTRDNERRLRLNPFKAAKPMPHPPSAPGVIFWFRNDLRLHDQLALQHAIALANERQTWLLSVYVHDSALKQVTPWGFARAGEHRLAWTAMAVKDVDDQLMGLGSQLLLLEGDPCEVLGNLIHRLDGPMLICEDIAAPEEQAQVQRLKARGVVVQTVWQSTLFAPDQLPFPPHKVPDPFTTFRHAVESQSVQVHAPLPCVQKLPPRPSLNAGSSDWDQDLATLTAISQAQAPCPMSDPRSAFPWSRPDFGGGERAALAHLARYCSRGLPHSYKDTRNGLYGIDYSTKWSPWLATGALSPRQAWAAIQSFEAAQGANHSTYWIGFELLWRDHFRWLHHKHGRRLYLRAGLSDAPLPASTHSTGQFDRWRQAQTGQDFIDAGMRELNATGYVSNRLRQNLASYLIHDLGCDWRAGAAWFEAQLIDYDVYSNQGNWLYLSGKGTDPRGFRRFNPEKQANDYDADGRYRAMWGSEKP
jgi:deoxyribodipyrimidine photo-lyase